MIGPCTIHVFHSALVSELSQMESRFCQNLASLQSLEQSQLSHLRNCLARSDINGPL